MLLSDASPEELTAMEEMASGSPAWQKELASQMARTPVHAIRKQERGWYMWAGSALAAMILIAAVLSFWWRYANAPERQLAEAYSHARIFELRMPGAGFAEVMPTRHSRSAGIIHTPAKLLDARAQIESQLKRKPDDAHWLQLEARADVLQENFDPAIEILNRLLASGPPTASLLADDAAAYFERGMATGSEDDRATALGYLRQADVLAPGNAMILFNEAVVMEDQGQSMSAVETWNRYLSFEHDSRWLAEGRRRLAGLEENLKRLNTLGDRGK
jgi:tetratricopeptide (TPR) repeat protein